MNEASRSAAHGTDREDAAVSEMQISIDSQSFVNLGQLMGSRHGIGSATARGSNAPRALADDLGASCLSGDDSEGMHDFDQIFHPRAEQAGGGGGGSGSSAWSGRDLYGRGGPADRDDDDDSLLPALPSRSCTPGSPRAGGGGDLLASSSNKAPFSTGEAGWEEEDFETTPVGDKTGGGGDCGGRGQAWTSAGALRVDATSESGTKPQRASLGADFGEGSSSSSSSSATARAAVVQAKPSSDVASGGGSPSAPHFLRDSWLHVPLDGDGDGAAGEPEPGRITDTESSAAASGGGGGPGDAGIDPHQQRYHEAAEAAARARRAAAAALADCGGCLVHAVDKAASLAASPLQQLARAAREQVDAGAEACARGQRAAIKAVDGMPQAPGERERARDKVALFLRSVGWRDRRVRSAYKTALSLQHEA